MTPRMSTDMTALRYRPPLGLPLYWRDEVSGVLPAAVWAYLHHMAGAGPAPTAEQLALVIDYARYFIEAPCWSGEELPELRRRARQLSTLEDLAAWVEAAFRSALDPF